MSRSSDSARDEWAGFYRASGIGLMVAGVLVLATLPLILVLVPSLAPSSVQSGLQSIQSQSLLFETTWGLYLASDLLYLLVFPALYIVLRQVNRTAMLVALIFNSAFVVIDVGVDIPLRLSLVDLSNSFTSAIGTAQQPFLATGQLAMDLANFTALIATFLQFSALTIASVVILRSTIFRKVSGYVGIVGGMLGLLFIPAFSAGSMMLSGLSNLGGFVLLVIWSFSVGYVLYKLDGATLLGLTAFSGTERNAIQ